LLTTKLTKDTKKSVFTAEAAEDDERLENAGTPIDDGSIHVEDQRLDVSHTRPPSRTELADPVL
jgi:hypothetical protein